MKYDVIVIGGGTAGLVTASGCARLGRRVALIEKERLGGDCLWTGCVPTKALVASGRVAWQSSHAARYGVDASLNGVSSAELFEAMRARQSAIEPNDSPEKFRALGIELLSGEASFVGDRRVTVGDRILSARHVVIATGSRTAVPPIEGLDEVGFVDHASFLRAAELPRRIAIVGGGYIGVEFAQFLARVGVEVVLLESGDTLVPHEDKDVSAFVAQLLASERVDVRVSTSVESVRRNGGEVTVTLSGGSDVTVDQLFIATGRRGNTEDLALDNARVALDGTYVRTDGYLRTTASGVWAAGDVHGGPQFTHVAAYEATKLVRNMLFPGKSAVDYSNVPRAIYVDPEIASVGMTEAEARTKWGDVETYVVPMKDVDRAVIDQQDGFLKLISRDGEIVGAHAVCAHASSLIGIVVVARAKKMSVRELGSLVMPYPSLAEAFQKVGAQHYQKLAGGWLGRVARMVAR